MALTPNPPSNSFKHFCKICKKGFLCGSALGGHMRAHGIGDEAGSVENNDDAGGGREEKRGTTMSPPPGGGGNKRMYALRTNPNRLRNCRVCENCGKGFLSWKSFLEHRTCGGKEDAESLLSPPSSECDDVDAMAMRPMKRKRTCRTKVSEEEDLATCLMMLSNAAVETRTPPAGTIQLEESSASASKDEERRHPIGFFISKAKLAVASSNASARGLFECKACKKVFSSHQALGGHRASHKKVKGCFAARLERHHSRVEDQDVLQNNDVLCPPRLETMSFEHERKGKLHECTVCRRVFSSGQALGGHKRCHWITASSADAGRFPAAPVQEQANLDLCLPTANQESVLSLKVSTKFFLRPWGTVDVHHKHDNDLDEGCRRNVDEEAEPPRINVEDEAESKVKMAKLSELEDMGITGGPSSPWLKVGIGPGDG